jgi:hypothetical protein
VALASVCCPTSVRSSVAGEGPFEKTSQQWLADRSGLEFGPIAYIDRRGQKASVQNIQIGRDVRTPFFFGGGCRPNPGPLEAAMLSRVGSYFRDGLGNGDDNRAEWIALSFACELSIAGGASDALTGSKLLPTPMRTMTRKRRSLLSGG